MPADPVKPRRSADPDKWRRMLAIPVEAFEPRDGGGFDDEAFAVWEHAHVRADLERRHAAGEDPVLFPAWATPAQAQAGRVGGTLFFHRLYNLHAWRRRDMPWDGLDSLVLMLRERAGARAAGDYARADAIRASLDSRYVLEDLRPG